ncbi:hypothetical protein [Desulfurobacterium sp.]
MIETYLLKLIVVFLIIVVSLAVIYFSVGKISFPMKTGRSGSIKFIEIKYISRNRGFVLIEVKDSKILLSFDETGFKKLKEWSNEEDSDI